MKCVRLYKLLLALLLNLAMEGVAAGDLPMLINFGSGGGWYDPVTGGQGFSFDIVPESNQLIAYWFTYPETGGAREWYIAQGDIDGSAANLVIYRTGNGLFDQPSEIALEAVGTARLVFDSCMEARWSYAFDASGPEGEIELDRLGTTRFCEQFLETASLEAVSGGNAWVNLGGEWLFEGCVMLGASESHGNERILFTRDAMILEIDRYASADCSGPVSLQVLELGLQRVDKTMARLEGREVIANRYLLRDPFSGQEMRQIWYVDDSGDEPHISHGVLDSPLDANGFPTELHGLFFVPVDP